MNDSTFRILSRTLLGLLVVWGAYVTIRYFAVPVHVSAMLKSVDINFLETACQGRGDMCVGFFSVFATIIAFLRALGPFVLYGILSAALLGVFVFRTFLRSEEWNLRVSLSPLAMVGLFIVASWALLMSIGFANNGGVPMNYVVDPIRDVYPEVSEEGLANLRANFDDLQDRGCLAPMDVMLGGAKVYRYTFSCMQVGFFTRVLAQMALVLLVIFNVLVLGRAVLHGLRLKGFMPFAEGVLSAGIGSCALVAILWTVAMLGFYTQVAGWALLIGIPAAGFVHSIHWAKAAWNERWEIDAKPYSLAVLLGWLLLTLFALNFLNVVRPFPIGWDDLGRYLNQPRLLVSYGAFIPTLSSFSWEYMTSLGFLLFGYDSIFGATLAMLINWSAGLLAVAAIWLFGRTYLGSSKGLLAALLYYALPMVGHFSFADMKVDNAIFAIGTLAALVAFLAVCPPGGDDDDANAGAPVLLLLALAGLLAGFAVGMKVTAVMIVMAIGTVMVGARGGWAGMLGATFLAWAVFTLQGVFRVSEVSGRVFGGQYLSTWGVAVACAVIGVAFVAFAFRNKTSLLRPLFAQVGVFGLAFIVAILPWVVANNASYGRLPTRLELSYSNSIAPAIVIDGGVTTSGAETVRTLPPELQVDTSNPACVSTSKAEELDRYWGNYTGAWHYLGLPWRAVMNTDTFGYYVTLVPALLLLPLLLLVPAFWSKENKWMRLLFGSTAFMVVQWMFFANGIVWYGIVAFLGLCLLLEALAVAAPTKSTRRVAGVLIGLSLLAALSHRMWQFDSMQSIFEYPLGKVSAETMEERTIPHYDDIREVIEQRIAATPDRPYVYRMGTFIPYFIPRNFEVLPLADNQLDIFNCLYQERDPAITLKRLQELGFNSMIFDLNTHTIEQDPQGSLHKKVEAFIEFTSHEELGIRIALNDPGAGIAYILLP